MKVIHVLRKPCSEGTVAANVLRHGTGALNIDECRIHSGRSEGGNTSGETALGQGSGWNAHNNRATTIDRAMPAGRWPANLVLQHLDGCVRVGTRTVRGDGHFPPSRPPGSQVSGPGHRGQTGLTERRLTTETIPAWVCAPGCPVAALDQQSGVSKSTGGRIGNAKGPYTNLGSTGWSGKHAAGDPGFGDTGGASRFFRQVTNDLPDYLRALISPDHLPDVVYLHVTEPDAFGWPEHGASSVHGMLVEAQSVEGQAAWLPEAFRALRPGGHLLLAAPDDEPVGDTGACAAEDVGFEVRDCILHASGADAALHYAAKASRAEREAGAGGAGGARANTHPTVKPIGVMRRLLADVPRARGLVLDPFVGSGTTLLACVDTGHDAIGIEREDEYVRIAQARLDHRRASGPKGRASGPKGRG